MHLGCTTSIFRIHEGILKPFNAFPIVCTSVCLTVHIRSTLCAWLFLCTSYRFTLSWTVPAYIGKIHLTTCIFISWSLILYQSPQGCLGHHNTENLKNTSGDHKGVISTPTFCSPVIHKQGPVISHAQPVQALTNLTVWGNIPQLNRNWVTQVLFVGVWGLWATRSSPIAMDSHSAW